MAFRGSFDEFINKFILSQSLFELSKLFTSDNNILPGHITIEFTINNGDLPSQILSESLISNLIYFGFTAKIRKHLSYHTSYVTEDFLYDRKSIEIVFVYCPRFPESRGFNTNDQMFLTLASEWMKKCHDIASEKLSLGIDAHNMFISGGALSRYYQKSRESLFIINHSEGDVDFWFDKSEIRKVICDKYLNSQLTNLDESQLTNLDESFKLYGLNQYILAFQNMDPYFGMPFQFILFKNVDKNHLKFDFLHCEPFYDPITDSLYVSPDQFKAIKEKILVPLKDEPKQKRIEKYTAMGWRLTEQDEKGLYI